MNKQKQTMPVLFVGHGSPMNAIENNRYTQGWQEISLSIPTPRAILVVSAHWYIPETKVTAMPSPKTIHDFYGFPQALFDVDYPAPGSPELASLTAQSLKTPVQADQSWGLDHGSWSVLMHMYPQANIPVYQLSINLRKSGLWHLELGAELRFLREQGILIMGSGNIVHNLSVVNFSLESQGYDWAQQFQAQSIDLISSREDRKLAGFEKLGSAAKMAIPSPEHYLPLLYILGASHKDETLQFFNQGCTMGSLSMDSVLIGDLT